MDPFEILLCVVMGLCLGFARDAHLKMAALRDRLTDLERTVADHADTFPRQAALIRDLKEHQTGLPWDASGN
jgi:hypothetical protein